MKIPDLNPSPQALAATVARGMLDRRTSATATAPSETVTTTPAEHEESIEQAVDRVRKVVEAKARDLQFAIDEDSGRRIVRVVDTVTKEIIRQIPSDEMLAISRALDKLHGLLLEQEA
jgi:flagellar protein FlaG